LKRKTDREFTTEVHRIRIWAKLQVLGDKNPTAGEKGALSGQVSRGRGTGRGGKKKKQNAKGKETKG